jgi:tetratricopeptide (TPR) repeat protein
MRTAALALVLAWALGVLFAAAAQAAPAKGPADELLERGLRSYAVGRFDEAIASFQRGYEIEPRADFLYALGQAQRMKGDCRAAVASYRAYLRTEPSERAAKPARQNLERCEKELAATPATPPPPVDVAVQPARPPAPPRWRDDRAAAVLVGVGAAALAVGGALWGVGEKGARDLADATRYDQFAMRGADADAFERERLAGIVTVAVGGALVTTAVARWIWVAKRRYR